MTQAHKAEILALKNQIIPISKSTVFHAKYDNDINGFNQGQKVSPFGYRQSLNFDGINDYIDFGNCGLSSLNNCTIEFWCKTSSPANWMLFKGQTTAEYILAVNGPESSVFYNSGGTGPISTYRDGVAANNLLRDGQWHHYVVVGANLSAWTAIQMSNYGSFQTHGSISDLRIWNYARSVQQITDNMNTEFKGDETGLVSYWKLNEGYGTTVYDSSSGYDATLVNGLTWSEGRTIVTLRSDGKFGGAVAIDQATENILATSGVDTSTEYSGSAYPFVSFDITSKVLALTPTGGTWSAQFEGKRDLTGNGYPVMYVYFSDWTWAASFGTDTGDWTKVSNTFSMPNPTGKTVIIAVYHMASGSTGTSYARKMQIELKPFSTSFVNGSRSLGKLYYPKDVLNLSSFSISCWFKTSSVYASETGNLGIGGWWYLPIIEWAPMSFRGNADSLNVLSIAIEPNTTTGAFRRIQMRNPFQIVGSTPSLVQDNIWYHMTLTYDGTTYRLYANGQLEASGVGGILTTYPDTVLMVGGGYDGAPNMLIDDLRIDNVAISADEILAWYHSGKPFYSNFDRSGVAY